MAIMENYHFKDIRLVALDLDGTLLDDNLNVSENTKAAIGNLLLRGIQVALVTGRPYKAARSVERNLEVNVPIIAHNGGKIFIPSEGEIANIKIPVEEALKVIRYAEERNLYTKVYIDDTLYIKEPDSRSLAFCKSHNIAYKAVGKLSENIHRDVNMFVIFCRKNTQQLVNPELKDIQVTVTTSTPRSIDVIAKGLSKKEGLKILAGHLGINRHEILAIGNSLNDHEMLSYAGIGIAMKNSDTSLLSKWDHISQYTNNEEGVYHIIRHI